MLRKNWVILACFGLMMTQGAGIHAQKPAPKAGDLGQALRGAVKVDGSSTVEPISSAIAEAFHKKFPNVAVTVGRSGTGGGFKEFTKGNTDISNASRPIKADELKIAQANKVKFIEVPIAYDGLTIVVHPSNKFVDSLTVDEVKKIFGDKGAKSWSEVRSGWPQEPIKIFSPGTDSGTFDYFKEVVAGKDGALRSDMSTSEDDNVLVTGVAGTPSAIGFFGVAYFEANKSKVRAVPIVNPKTNEKVTATPATIESGEYAPFSRPLFVYINIDSIKRPELRQFVKFYMLEVAEKSKLVGYVPLPASVYEIAKKHIDSRTPGTHFMNADLSGKSGALVDIYKPDAPTVGK